MCNRLGQTHTHTLTHTWPQSQKPHPLTPYCCSWKGANAGGSGPVLVEYNLCPTCTGIGSCSKQSRELGIGSQQTNKHRNKQQVPWIYMANDSKDLQAATDCLFSWNIARLICFSVSFSYSLNLVYFLGLFAAFHREICAHAHASPIAQMQQGAVQARANGIKGNRAAPRDNSRASHCYWR